MVDDVINLGFLIIALLGFFLIISSPMDTSHGRKKNFLGFEFVVGSELLTLIYNIAHSIEISNLSGIIFNAICLLVALVGSFLTSWNAFHDPKKSKSVITGLVLIVIIMIIQFLHDLI